MTQTYLTFQILLFIVFLIIAPTTAILAVVGGVAIFAAFSVFVSRISPYRTKHCVDK